MIILIAAVIFFGYACFIEPFDLRVKEETITTEKASTTRILLFSDTHFSDWYTTEHFQTVVDKINEAEPDIVVFTGDLIDHFRYYKGNIEDISTQLSLINAPLGKYAVFGNHDYGGGAEAQYESIMNAGGFTVLTNQYTSIEEKNIGLIGIDDLLLGNGSASVCSCASTDQFNIVLCHEPDIADQIQEYNIDLLLSGHTHGGQVRIPIITNLGLSIFPSHGNKYLSGMYSLDNSYETKVYVTSGIGMTALPMRFLAPPDITVININSSK